MFVGIVAELLRLAIDLYWSGFAARSDGFGGHQLLAGMRLRQARLPWEPPIDTRASVVRVRRA
jgi:hypothetical protein